ncbi:MAG TPA: bifunctional aspartate kinase/homoserine dehydrogenase I [Gammaproteobacteria bacterium]|nr:bifunctional aspartate kinase/homoserine dehydrogenase I [Gammaproteobacteria bacterium]
MAWTVHKFGGSSLADASCFRRVARIVLEQPHDGNLAVVVSAIGGMTDALLDLIKKASSEQSAADSIERLRTRYRGIVDELLPAERAQPLLERFEKDIADIESVLKALALVRTASNRSRDMVSGFGELWSARLLAALLAAEVAEKRRVLCVDARDVLVVEASEMGAGVVWDLSAQRCRAAIPGDFRGVAVITGFIARDREGLQTTLGRNGSDYSASIFGALLGAEIVHIWTDVEGVMSGDPRRVPEATVIGEISYNEAMELAYFGAKVIHPQTMAPAVAHNIPLRIRSTFKPEHPGTLISATPAADGTLIKGITGIDGVALINLEGAGMIGVPGTADRLFGALREAAISVMLISQGSSEHSICFAVAEPVADQVKRLVERAFAAELAQGLVQKVEVTKGCGVLAVVGDGMAGLPGAAGRFFSTLGNSGINVRAIAQGASERNISAVIASKDMTRALRAVHGSFYLSAKTVSIGLIGPGSVGGALLEQMATAATRLRATFNLDLRVRAIGGSRRMALAERRVDLGHWRSLYEAGEPMDRGRLVDHIQADHLPHAVLIDCTASSEVAAQYAAWLERGIHVITPNKRAHSGPLPYYQTLKHLSRNTSAHFLYEATVGAGLPVIQTLKDLVETGDEIASISGIFSGTLAYLFNVFDGARPFSAIVRDARDRGYTEPDPRDDLSGLDVARKAVILAREAGLDLELADIGVENLVPDALAEGPVDEFLSRLAQVDAEMAERVARARRDDKVLRYVAELDFRTGRAAVRLGSFGLKHPFANISLTDNIVQFATRRYCDNPLIVRGPGAGPDVTAAGIFADLLRLCSMLSGTHE